MYTFAQIWCPQLSLSISALQGKEKEERQILLSRLLRLEESLVVFLSTNMAELGQKRKGGIIVTGTARSS